MVGNSIRIIRDVTLYSVRNQTRSGIDEMEGKSCSADLFCPCSVLLCLYCLGCLLFLLLHSIYNANKVHVYNTLYLNVFIT
jgi:hypothetical protein